MNGSEQNPFAEEAQERWGDTDAYKESARRTKQHTAADWTRIKAEVEAVESGLAAAMQAGEAADGDRAMDLAEQARLHIDRNFYPCSHKMHVGLADMYTADARFTAHYDDRAAGLATFVAEAIRANAARNGQ
jgi:hypothetical protein